MASSQVYAPLWAKLLSAFGITDYLSAQGVNNEGLKRAFQYASAKLTKQMTQRQSTTSYTPITWADRQALFAKCFANNETFNAIKRSNASVGMSEKTPKGDEQIQPSDTVQQPVAETPSFDIAGTQSFVNMLRVPYITGFEDSESIGVVYISPGLFYNIAYQMYTPETSSLSDLTIVSPRSNVPIICHNMSVQTQLVSAIREKFSGKPPIGADISYVAETQGQLLKCDINLPALANDAHPYLTNNPNMIVVKYSNTQGDMINITGIITDPSEIAKIGVCELARHSDASSETKPEYDPRKFSLIAVYPESMSEDDYSYYNDPGPVLSELGVVSVVVKPATYVELEPGQSAENIDPQYEGIMCFVGCVNIRDWMDCHRHFHKYIMKDLDASHGYLNETERKEKIKDIIKAKKTGSKETVG